MGGLNTPGIAREGSVPLTPKLERVELVRGDYTRGLGLTDPS